MGILRSDRVSGLGGANAINGSVFFGTSDLTDNRANLAVTNTSELDIGDGNFTIEYWFYDEDTTADQLGVSVAQSEYTNTSSNSAFNVYHYNKGFRIYNRVGGGFSLIFTNDNSWTPSTWHHFAWVREGTGSSENKVYIDGTLIGSAFTNGVDYTAGQHWLIGANFYTGSEKYGTNPQYGFSGYLSNVRVSNVARYTGNFTAPTTRYEKDANTILLACQSPGNILKEETGKTLTVYTGQSLSESSFASVPPMASHISPDVGEDYGTTFADNTKFDTLSYMVPPGGRTRDRYLKSTGDIVSGNLVWHIDAGNPTSYAGVTTSGTTIYDLQGGTGVSAVGIATLASGHSSYPAPVWTAVNGGAWYLGSDSDLDSPSNVGQEIIMPQYSLGNDNYTVNVWIKLKAHSQQADGLSYVISHNDGSPVSYHAHVKEVSGEGRIGAGAYYTGWTYDYASGAADNTVIALNEWYMLTWVNTAQYTQSMYVNGVIQKLNGGAYTWNSRSSNNSPVNSTSYANNETTNAWIGQIQYYNDTLTADEIIQNYNAHKCRYDQ